jgi:FkbM family methyltransferase
MSTRHPTLRRLMQEKSARESAMLDPAAPGHARDAYFASLASLAAERSGLLHAVLPEFGHPLYLRAGTTDLAALRRIALGGRLDWLPEAPPRRILDIGAHAGYAAAALARRYPDAGILCIEPDHDTHRMLVLNTVPYPNIRRDACAAWHGRTRLAASRRDTAGLGMQLTDTGSLAERGIPALPVGELLLRAGMVDADMVLCDTAGAEIAIFADPGAAWLARVDTAAIETAPDDDPALASMLAACFPASRFDMHLHGTTRLFRRRMTGPGAPPRRLHLLHSAPGLLPFDLHDVPDGSAGFFILNGDSCQLHPNPPGGPHAGIRFTRALDGQTHLSSGIVHAGPQGAPIAFAITLAAPDGTAHARAGLTLGAMESGRLDIAIPQDLAGPQQIILETAMAPGAPHNRNAWARFIAPVLF